MFALKELIVFMFMCKWLIFVFVHGSKKFIVIKFIGSFQSNENKALQDNDFDKFRKEQEWELMRSLMD